MSLQSALEFIQLTRRNAELKSKLRVLGPQADLSLIATVGADFGLFFTPEELRTAFKHDWAMRWLQQEKRDS